MASRAQTARRSNLLRGIVTALVFLVVVVLLMIWLAGGFHRKIDRSPTEASSRSPAQIAQSADSETVPVRVRQIPRVETAVGTVRAVHEATVASKLLAKVMEVNVTAGQRVRKDEVLVRLDDEDLTARLDQAQSAVDAALSVRDQAKIEYDRIERLLEQQAASKLEWDRVQTVLKTAEAELQRARQAANEARTVLGYATIAAPIDGLVVDKRVEVGDTVTPGQPLLTLYDPTRMQLVASVRESLTRRLEVGQTIGVNIDTLDHTCEGLVSEIVPEADSASRSFAVKVTGPCPPGVYSGMFGRLLIPLEEESLLVIPTAAVRRVGQLDLVQVIGDGQPDRRAVKLGRTFEDEVEVLSGLREGEHVVIAPRTDGSSR